MQVQSRARSSGRNAALTSRAGGIVEELDRARSCGRNRAIAGGTAEELDSLLGNKAETALRARSRGRSQRSEKLESIDNGTLSALAAAPSLAARPKSHGRGDRNESNRQLAERSRTPGKGAGADGDRSRSSPAPLTLGTIGRQSASERYDPAGPMSDSRALVPVIKEESVSS